MAIFIDEAAVSKILGIAKTVELIEEAFFLFGKGEAFNTPRVRTRVKKGALHILPAAMPTKGVFGYKAYTSFRNNIKFRYYLHSSETGGLLAILDADLIGRLRTGAASGVATKYMSDKNSSKFVIFGAGAQARSQIDAVMLVRSIDRVSIISRTPASAEKLASELTGNVSVCMDSNASIAVKDADIITTITSSSVPVLLSEWELKKGIHINACGSNALIRAEIDEKIVEKAFIAVDDKEVAKLEAGDLLPLLEKGRLHWNAVSELGDIIAENKVFNREDCDITLFESQGMGLQDLICAEYVYRITMEQGTGIELPI